MYTETFKDSKHEKTCQENNDESRSSRSSDSSSVVIDGSGSSRHSEGVKPEIILENNSSNESSTHINGNGIKSKASTDSIGSAQKDEQNDLSSESSANPEDDNSTSGCSSVYDGILDLGMSPSSIGSANSDLIGSGTHINGSGMKLKASTDSIGSAQKDEQNNLSSESSANSEDDNNTPGCSSTSQVYDGILDLGMSPTSRPPLQVMNRSAENDPCRIPASVFDNPNNPIEWSLPSNESLFSIHLDNISFSRNQAFGEIGKSVEPDKSIDLHRLSPFSQVTENTDKSRSDERQDLERTETADEVSHSVTRIQKDVKNSYPAIFCSSSSVSSHSHGSERTFICKGQDCYCKCSLSNCFCEQPSFGCFNYCWAFFYCCSGYKRWHNQTMCPGILKKRIRVIFCSSGADTESFAEAACRRMISEKVPELNSRPTAKSHRWHCFSCPWSRCGNCCCCFSCPWSRYGNCCCCFSCPWSRCGNCCCCRCCCRCYCCHCC